LSIGVINYVIILRLEVFLKCPLILPSVYPQPFASNYIELLINAVLCEPIR